MLLSWASRTGPGGAGYKTATASAPGDEDYRQRLRADGARCPTRTRGGGSAGRWPSSTGRQDRIAGYADQFRRLWCYPAGSLAVLDRAGHYLPFEQPRALAALVSEWRSRCEPGGRPAA